MSKPVEINNELITWAISRAGYELQNFAEKFPRVTDWLEGTKKPTIPQLKKFANKVKLPFGYLFLDRPPEETLPIPYYRTLQGETREIDLNVRDTILMLQKRQEWLQEYYIERDYDRLEFVGKFNETDTKEDIIRDIRDTLGLQKDWARNHANWQNALKALSQRCEEHRIILVFNSIVGNNTHRPIPVEECRGFVLVDEYAPFMFINSADTKAAQMFTLIHELAHIWIGKSAAFDFRKLQPTDNQIETLCDQIAAEFLVPEDLFEQEWQQLQDFKLLAKKFKVSPIVIGRRALDLHKISRDTFFDFYNDYMDQFFKKKESQGGGGNFYATLKYRLNPRFLAEVNRAAKQNKLLYRNAYELTGLRSETYHNAIKELGV
jgi:Zn-dependent peptidase ImmA (M78 family)